MTTPRHYTSFDSLLINIDQAVRTVFGRPTGTGRPNPAEAAPDTELTDAAQQETARLMRINHTGEVCAQALYQGQALTAENDAVRAQLETAANEENDHLHWCEARLHELGSHTSLLNPLFYAGAFALGALSGRLGDRWNLGFLAETERQVVEHLQDHLNRLPPDDKKSRSILSAMQRDEGRHAATAVAAGGASLPLPVRLLMRAAAKVMTRTTRWI
jgi:ubiquinone biosynthesis monooxygenase Coq7